ncbi:hypothetical protein A7J50_1331 [Pseudomonas antarctica]|uniref:Uncharacterized protein n=1 Tax=Pseudomonas antarctica TaxID=219572 RepID=A0A172YWV4_9PSED|nr:hypothetical protein [Pseudomonas antarctica]ANF84765.1 hypothetical protein A7J50_1331 [Pseudomonas antarctica]
METKHTPGPWRIGTPGPNGCYTVGTKRGLMTAMVAHSINEPDQAEQANADAKLIAAAPDLLAAAIKVLNGLNERIDSATENRTATPIFDGIADLHDAINKATA